MTDGRSQDVDGGEEDAYIDNVAVVSGLEVCQNHVLIKIIQDDHVIHSLGADLLDSELLGVKTLDLGKKRGVNVLDVDILEVNPSKILVSLRERERERAEKEEDGGAAAAAAAAAGAGAAGAGAGGGAGGGGQAPVNHFK